MRTMGFLCVMCCCLLSHADAHAQVSFEGCVVKGIAVASVQNDSLNDIAMATFMRTPNGMAPVIVYNSLVVASASPSTRVFFYAHECAHHVLGHALQGLRLGQEQQADCWSIRMLVSMRIFEDAQISEVESDLARFGKADWTHLPGPQRAINLRRCLQ
jgi:hypothetical protein